MLLARALLAFLLLPGVVAFLLPLAVIAPDVAYDWRGLALAIPGTLLLLGCVREFYAAGKGTLAPWSPPRHLVVSGPYRFSRNPMYLGVLLILAGWTAGFRSRALANYTVVVAMLFYLRVLLFEEPWLDDTHHGGWLEYKNRVPRWIGRPRSRTDA